LDAYRLQSTSPVNGGAPGIVKKFTRRVPWGKHTKMLGLNRVNNFKFTIFLHHGKGKERKQAWGKSGEKRGGGGGGEGALKLGEKKKPDEKWDN